MKTAISVFLCIGLLMPMAINATTCYQCESGEDNNCKSPGIKEFFTMDTCETTTLTRCYKGTFLGKYKRGCSVCESTNVGGQGLYCCDSYKCNAGVTLMAPRLAVLLISCFVAAKRFF